MTGVTISARFDDEGLSRKVARYAALGRPLLPLARAIGVVLVRGTQDRFTAGRDPQDEPWEPLTTLTQSVKRGPGILREAGMRGGLMGSITFRAEAGLGNATVQVGTNKVYGAVHQFGAEIRAKNPSGLLVFRTARGRVFGAAPQVTIPARPYLGLSRTDRDKMAMVVRSFYRRAIGLEA